MRTRYFILRTSTCLLLTYFLATTMLAPNASAGVERQTTWSEKRGTAIFIASGAIAFSSYSVTQEIYDPETNECILKSTPEVPVPKGEGACAVLNNKLYHICGVSRLGWNRNDVYDPVEDTWTTRASAPCHTRYPAATTLNGKIHLFGGKDADDTIRDTHYVYDPETDTWSVGLKMPAPRYGAVALTVGEKIYLIGGSNATANLNTVEYYDSHTDSWESRAPLPVAKYLADGAVVGGKIYVFSSHADISAYMYDPTANLWSAIAAPKYARWAYRCAVLDGKIYLIGNVYLAWVTQIIEMYDPSTNTYKDKAPTNERRDLAAVGVLEFYVPATVQVSPEVMSLKRNGRWLTSYIELPNGYSVGDIDVSTIRLNYEVCAEAKPIAVGDHDNDYVLDLMVKFSVAEIPAISNIGKVELTITGQVKGNLFKGFDKITIVG